MATRADELWGSAARMVKGDPVGAEAMLQQAIALDPDHAPSLHLLGLLAGRAGDQARSAALLSRAIEAGTPEQAEASGLLLAAAFARWTRLDEAEAAYADVVARMPASREGWFELGLLLGSRGRHERAVDALRHATALDPSFAPAHAALASALLALGSLDEAAEAAIRARSLAPDARGTARRLAAIRNAQGRFAEAAVLCRGAEAEQDDAALLNTLGIALQTLDAEEAAACFRRALAADPGFGEARYNLAAVLKELGRTDDAVAEMRALAAAAPDHAATQVALAMAPLPPVYADVPEVGRRREQYARALDDLARFADRYGPAALAEGIGAAQPFLLAYQGCDDNALQRRYGALVAQAMAARYPPTALAGPLQPGERLRLGIVSGHFRDHSVWRLPTRGWVEQLDRDRFELIGYHTGALCDGTTRDARALFDRWHQGPTPIARWRDLIAADRPHALLFPEIGMDPAVAQLAGMRLAPVQYGSWGHPVTTGYPTIDFYLSADAMEPDDTTSHYTEQLVRLPGLSTPITVEPRASPIKTRQELGLPHGTLFWCGQSLSKYLPQHDHLLARIAAELPAASFLFIEYPAGAALTQRFRDRLGRAFQQHGLLADRHCHVLPRMDAGRFSELLGHADVVLDSVGWSGCNSLVEALAHARPIVTLPGGTMRSRHGAALLRAIGLGRHVCADEEAYVATAVALGQDPEKRAAMAAAIRAGLPRLDDRRCVPALARHLLQACAIDRSIPAAAT